MGGVAASECSRSELLQLLRQCKQATALGKPWQPPPLHRQLVDQYLAVKTLVQDLVVRFPSGQEQLPVAGLLSAGHHSVQQFVLDSLRPVLECAVCGKRETAVSLQRCGACRGPS